MSGRFIWTGRCAGTLSIAGAVAGILSGLLGVGGGFVMVPALQRATDLATRSIAATSLAVIALVSLTGVVASLSSGTLHAGIALPFVMGSVAGMGAGGALAARLPQPVLKTVFAAICLVVAAAMIAKSMQG